IDILFANAGIAEYSPLGTITESHFGKTLSVNVKGLLFSVRKALALFQGGGSIILTGAAGASKGYEGFSAYSATKAAIRSFAILDLRSETPQHPGKYRQSWPDRYIDFRLLAI